MGAAVEAGGQEEKVLQLLKAEYGLVGGLLRLPGENVNFLVTAPDGERYVLKIASNDRDNAIIDMEHRAVEHVATGDTGLCVPHTILTGSGNVVAQLHTDNQAVMRAQLLEFVEGTPWGELTGHNESLLGDLGRKLARLDLVLADFKHPAMYRTHQWDLTMLSQHRSRVGLIRDPERRRILEWIFHFWTAEAKPRLGDLPGSFIHNDVNDENILVAGNQVAGLLDFGDSLHNPIVCGLAIALAYVLLRSDAPLECAARIVAAYHQVRPLTDDEVRVLLPLICGRLANTVAVAAERRLADSRHPNWFVTEDAAWCLMEKLYTESPAEAYEVLSSGVGKRKAGITGSSPEELVKHRRLRIGPSLSLAYKQPIKMVRGQGQFLFDHRGRPYLDLVNNICHVGHCNSRVVEAGQKQMATLNTNTRYLYDGLTEYAERLCATMPGPLNTCFFVNSGSEANELALRLARTHTGRKDVVVVDAAYHGISGRLISISPYKFMGPGGAKTSEPWVHTVPMADGYRGRYKGQGIETGINYGNEVARVIHGAGKPIAAFISETIWSCGGQVVPPAGYLTSAFEHVRNNGGLCIVDEVQVGFGRVGKAFWGFQLQDVVPDIVVMGKPMGNGHPVAAVVTTRDIASSFNNGMEFFSSFGGNPVSCAIGLAVLDVIEEESLQAHALHLGEHIRAGLKILANRHPIIGDVRGEGLFLGAELVSDHNTLAPAAREASRIVELMKQRGILMSTDGPLGNVLKIKPPMVITGADVDMVLRCLNDVLSTV